MIYINSNIIQNLNNNFFVVMDFDRTITSIFSENSWEAILKSKYAKKEHLEIHKDLYNKYVSYETDTSMDLEYRRKKLDNWYSLILKLFYSYNYNSNVFKKSVENSKLEFRDGAISFFNNLNKKNIPVIIVSAGIENIIKEFFLLNNIDLSNISIISNKIDFSIKSSTSYVHALNKNLQVWDEIIINKIKEKKYAVLIGDLISDINMLPDMINKTKIKIGFLDNNIKENIKLYNKIFDIVLTDNTSFDEVGKILKL
ncbi:MAG: haloacid dehalogenase-like hydrolase [Clostridia bacterium]|nr:haloacid dehalogenase-like hydrolase [Clostridia bacterium]